MLVDDCVERTIPWEAMDNGTFVKFERYLARILENQCDCSLITCARYLFSTLYPSRMF